MPKFQFVRLIYTVPVLVAGVKWGGLDGFCYGKLLNSIVTFSFFILLLKMTVKVRFRALFNLMRTPFLCVSVMAVCLYLGTMVFNWYGFSGIGYTCILIVAGGFIYLASLTVSDPALLRNLYKNVARAF